MTNSDFAAMVASFPTREKVIGHKADGTPLVIQVRSMFGTSND